MESRRRRVEGISLLYLAFFVLAVLSPSLYRRGYFGLSETLLEEATIFLFGMAGFLTFSAYERLMERREAEAHRLETDVERLKKELLDSYAYIGSLNRKMELIKRLTSDASAHLVDHKQLPRELFQGIVQGALSATGAESGLLRLIEHASLRTESEVQIDQKEKRIFRVPNRELRALNETHASHAFLATEDGQDVLVVPSDAHTVDTKAYLLLFLPTQHIATVDVPLLKLLVNQAEVIRQREKG